MSLTFGAPASAPATAVAAAAPLFGAAPLASTASVAPSFPAFGTGTTTTTTATTSAANPPLSFGAFGTSNPTSIGSLNFPTASVAPTALAPAPTAPAAATIAPLAAATSAALVSAAAALTAGPAAALPPKVGLGGVNPETSHAGCATPSVGGGVGGEAAKIGGTEQQSLKEQEIPTSLKAEVAAFKDHVKRVKTVRENIARFSAKPFHKVFEDVNAMTKLLGELGNNLHKNVTTVEKLRFDTHRELKNAEIAVRTRDTPQGLQYENVAPMSYFQYMVDDFEARMQTYRQQIEQLESYLAASTAVQAAPLSPQTLAALIQQIQDSFMEIAGQLQVVHEKIQTQKEHYLNYRKFILDDDSDVFAASDGSQPLRGAARAGGRTSLAATGPPPFGSTFAQKSTMASIFAALQATQAPPNTQPQVAAAAIPGSLPFPAPGATNSAAPPTLSLNATKPTDPWGKLSAAPNTFGTVGFGAVGSTSTLNTTASSGFGLPALSQTSFNSAGTLFGASPNPTGVFGSPSVPLTLAKPPAGNKRGKR